MTLSLSGTCLCTFSLREARRMEQAASGSAPWHPRKERFHAGQGRWEERIPGYIHIGLQLQFGRQPGSSVGLDLVLQLL